MKKVITSILLLMFIGGCGMTAADEEMQRHSKDQAMTLGVAQKEIRVGMSQGDVAAALGSPNIVSKDSQGKESWIYDKIASEASYSKSSVGGAAGAGGGTGNTLILGILTGGYESGAASTTQKTLTVVIKFNDEKLVESFSYHSSKF